MYKREIIDVLNKDIHIYLYTVLGDSFCIKFRNVKGLTWQSTRFQKITIELVTECLTNEIVRYFSISLMK